MSIVLCYVMLCCVQFHFFPIIFGHEQKMTCLSDVYVCMCGIYSNRGGDRGRDSRGSGGRGGKGGKGGKG